MAKHTIYVSDTTERLVAELKLDAGNYSQLVERALLALVQHLPPAKVERAVSKIARQQTAGVKEQLRGQLGLDDGE